MEERVGIMAQTHYIHSLPGRRFAFAASDVGLERAEVQERALIKKPLKGKRPFISELWPLVNYLCWRCCVVCKLNLLTADLYILALVFKEDIGSITPKPTRIRPSTPHVPPQQFVLMRL